MKDAENRSGPRVPDGRCSDRWRLRRGCFRCVGLFEDAHGSGLFGGLGGPFKGNISGFGSEHQETAQPLEPRTFPNMRQESGSTKRNNTKPLNPNKPSGRPCALGQVRRHSRRSKRDERLGQVMAELGGLTCVFIYTYFLAENIYAGMYTLCNYAHIRIYTYVIYKYLSLSLSLEFFLFHLMSLKRL